MYWLGFRMNLSTYRKNTGRVFRIRPSQKAAILSMVNFDELSIFLIDYKVDSHWPAVSTYFIYIIIVVFKRATIYESIVIPESNRLLAYGFDEKMNIDVLLPQRAAQMINFFAIILFSVSHFPVASKWLLTFVVRALEKCSYSQQCDIICTRIAGLQATLV